MLLRATLVLAASVSVSTPAALGARLFEIDIDGADDGVVTFNPGFSFGGDTTTASQSAPSTAYGTSGADSIFGGDGAALPDTYIYTYSPDSQPDNLAIPTGTDLGEGNVATGLTGGGAGLYRVYATFPFTSNVSGGLTRYEVVTDADSFFIDINQNDADDLLGTDGRGGVWVYLGDIQYASGSITVTQQPTAQNSFVSMRAHGLLFERVPAPGTVTPLALAAAAATRRRR